MRFAVQVSPNQHYHMDESKRQPHQQSPISRDSVPASPVSSPLPQSLLGGATTKSRNIPMPSNHVRRTESEVQLCEDMALAEQKDLNMFYRLVNGIRERQIHMAHSSEHPSLARHLQDSDSSIANIIQTRNSAVRERPGVATLETIRSQQPSDFTHDRLHRRQEAQPSFVPTVDVDTSSEDWSVTGYEDPMTRTLSLEGIELGQEDDTSDEIFDLDL